MPIIYDLPVGFSLPNWPTSHSVSQFISYPPPHTYPSKPIRIIVPFPPGGGTDITARLLRQPLSKALGQTVVLDNRPSASGILGTDVAAKATADGYTLLFACASHTVKPAVDAKLPYNPEADLMAIILVGKTLLLLYVDSKVAARAGATSQAQLILALLSRMAGVRMQHIPYRGAGGDGDGSGRSRSLRPVASQAISNIATSLPSDAQPWVSMSRYSLPARDTGRRIMAIVV